MRHKCVDGVQNFKASFQLISCVLRIKPHPLDVPSTMRYIASCLTLPPLSQGLPGPPGPPGFAGINGTDGDPVSGLVGGVATAYQKRIATGHTLNGFTLVKFSFGESLCILSILTGCNVHFYAFLSLYSLMSFLSTIS